MVDCLYFGWVLLVLRVVLFVCLWLLVGSVAAVLCGWLLFDLVICRVCLDSVFGWLVAYFIDLDCI